MNEMNNGMAIVIICCAERDSRGQVHLKQASASHCVQSHEHHEPKRGRNRFLSRYAHFPFKRLIDAASRSQYPCIWVSKPYTNPKNHVHEANENVVKERQEVLKKGEQCASIDQQGHPYTPWDLHGRNFTVLTSETKT